MGGVLGVHPDAYPWAFRVCGVPEEEEREVNDKVQLLESIYVRELNRETKQGG